MRVPSWVPGRRSRPSVALSAALSVLLLATTVIPPAAHAVTPVSVVASGAIQTGFGSPSTFDLAVTDDGAGSVGGWLEVGTGGSIASGPVTCLSVSGNQVVAGGESPNGGGGSLWFTVFLTDNGSDGAMDTAAVDGPTNMALPDCSAPSPPQQVLYYGQVTILTGASDAGTVSGQGTSSIGGFATRTFDFSGERDAGGTVTGTYSISESSGFATSGTIICLDIRGSHATVIGQGSNPTGGGSPYLYATFFVDDLGPNGSGDLISFNAYDQTSPNGCLAAQENPGDPLTSGDIDVNGSGGGGTPAPAATVVATGAVETGSFQADTFDVAVISDGAGGLDGTIQMTRNGSSVSGTVTCLSVVANEIVVGGQADGAGPGGGPLWFTLYLTDNGPDGFLDTAALDGPTNMGEPDCSSASPPQQALYYGQVTILDGSPEAGTAVGNGTSDLGSGYTRTFDFDALRDESGVVSGTFSISESQGFNLSGTVDCLDIRGTQAMLIGHGSSAGAGTLYATIFVDDLGAAGAGDTIAVNAYGSMAPPLCLAAQEYPSVGLLSGDIAVNAGVPPTPSPSPTPNPTPSPTPTPPPGGPADLDPGGTLSSDVGSDGPDAGEPVVASVTTPVGGTVQIVTNPSTDPPAAGYGLIGQALDITAPAASAASPLVFVFRLDSTAIPSGDTAATIQVFRNGVPVADCTGSLGIADPDPCVELRETLADGDVQLTVLTSAASIWSLGVAGPELAPIEVPSAVIPIGSTASATAVLTDPGELGGHVANWDWGDGTGSTGEIPVSATDSATITGNHVYAAPGVYTVAISVTDPSGQSASTSFLYVVVYDPNGSFATGGGWIVPGGASSDPGDILPGLDGASKANFGFTIKYQNGASAVPGGSLTFHYKTGDLDLSSTGFDWLVVTNQNWAKFRGLAKIQGSTGEYPFRVDARDGKSAEDRFVIKVWSPGADPDHDSPLYVASGTVQGQVTIHK